ncbi:MAG: hypothetical protein K5Q00_01145 [Gammaproteobacteria bacterium]|nr:hypothetical protein [Gammaproteobacteria bacterium]
MKKYLLLVTSLTYLSASLAYASQPSLTFTLLTATLTAPILKAPIMSKL